MLIKKKRNKKLSIRKSNIQELFIAKYFDSNNNYNNNTNEELCFKNWYNNNFWKNYKNFENSEEVKNNLLTIFNGLFDLFNKNDTQIILNNLDFSLFDIIKHFINVDVKGDHNKTLIDIILLLNENIEFKYLEKINNCFINYLINLGNYYNYYNPIPKNKLIVILRTLCYNLDYNNFTWLFEYDFNLFIEYYKDDLEILKHMYLFLNKIIVTHNNENNCEDEDNFDPCEFDYYYRILYILLDFFTYNDVFDEELTIIITNFLKKSYTFLNQIDFNNLIENLWVKILKNNVNYIKYIKLLNYILQILLEFGKKLIVESKLNKLDNILEHKILTNNCYSSYKLYLQILAKNFINYTTTNEIPYLNMNIFKYILNNYDFIKKKYYVVELVYYFVILIKIGDLKQELLNSLFNFLTIYSSLNLKDSSLRYFICIIDYIYINNYNLFKRNDKLLEKLNLMNNEEINNYLN